MANSSRAQFWRREPKQGLATLLVIATAGLALFALVGGLMVTADYFDRVSAHHEEQLVLNGLKLKDRALRDCITPNIMWDDTVAHLDNRYDVDWANANIGEYLTTSCDVRRVLVLDGRQQILGAWIDGEEAKRDLPRDLTGPITRLTARIRQREAARGALTGGRADGAMIARAIDDTATVTTGDGPVVVSASLVQPDFGKALPSGDKAPIVITVQPVDAKFLDWLGDHFLLESPHIELPPFPAKTAAETGIVISGDDHAPVVRIDWNYMQPARDLVGVVAPPVGILILVLLVAPTLVILQNRRQRDRLSAAMVRANAGSEAKSRFIANMSHEIRTPMNGVIGMLHALRRKTTDAEQRQLIDEALASGALLQGLLNDVLDLSRIESGAFELQPAPLDPESLLREVLTLFAVQAQDKGIALTSSVSGSTGLVVADGLRLRQLCLNLIGNAVKFTAVGRVDVRCTLSDGASPDERRFRLEVEDTGIGIPKASQGQLFRRFSQADGSVVREYGGSGLGLSICAALVDQMGGDIGFSSVDEKGSTFWFEIPLRVATMSLEPEEAPSDQTEGAAPSGLRVLVVDDNPTNLKVATLLLDAIGAQVETASNGQESLQLCEAGLYDLVLMDVQMPIMDGVTATRSIRALGGPSARVPIVGLTANVLPRQREEYLAAGMDDVAEKPINPQRLFDTIEAVLQGARASGKVAAPLSA